jgi:ribosomal protein S27AE
MPQKQKINLEKVLASLNTVCPKCGCSITPDKIRRIDSERIVYCERVASFSGLDQPAILQ